MKITFNRDFANRDQLDAYVRKVSGGNIDANQEAGHTIEGTADELKALGLSEETTIYGIAVAVSASVDPVEQTPVTPVSP